MEIRKGYVYGFSAYAIWGFFPIYFKKLLPTGPLEIVAHRVVWSFLFIAFVITAMRRWRLLREMTTQPGKLAGMVIAAVLIGTNWGIYVYGVNSARVLEASLGYFITPLVTVLIGVSVLGERLSTAAWTAMGIGGVAVVVLTADYGHLPYIALLLALSFSAYSLVKKRLAVPAADGLFIESLVLAPPCLAYLGWLVTRDELSFGQVSAPHTVLLVLAGVVTACPLLLFAGAANRLPLSALGLLQYLTPSIQLVCAVLLFHEPMPLTRLIGFALVWLALSIFTVDGLRNHRQARIAEVRGECPRIADPAVRTSS